MAFGGVGVVTSMEFGGAGNVTADDVVAEVAEAGGLAAGGVVGVAEGGVEVVLWWYAFRERKPTAVGVAPIGRWVGEEGEVEAGTVCVEELCGDVSFERMVVCGK